MDQDVKDWLVRLTESEAANSKAIELLTNHWTEIRAKQDMTWKVVAVIGVSLIPLISLIVSLLVLVVKNGGV